MRITDCFSKTYAEARSKFLDACAEVGAVVTSFPNPAAGADGKPLCADVARAGPENAEAILITCSGTHGVEGFCGSGVQVGTFRLGLKRFLTGRQAIVAIHAINPYGFSWLRRVNEDNVDLNRNFVDHSKPHRGNSAYDALHALLVPNDWDGLAKAEADRQLQEYMQQHGMAALQAAITGGQYDHTDGLFYGGREPTWSNRTLHLMLQPFIRTAKRVAFIDYHTGLGPQGHGEIICLSAPGSPAFDRTHSWYGEVTSPWDGTSVSAPVQGSIEAALERELGNAELTAVALEYGTIPPLKVLEALRADNWLHLKDKPGSRLRRKIKAQMRRAFYLDKDLWKEQVWARAEEVLHRAIAGLSRS